LGKNILPEFYILFYGIITGYDYKTWLLDEILNFLGLKTTHFKRFTTIFSLIATFF